MEGHPEHSGKTEENVKDGLRIQEIVPFFVKNKLKLRVYDIFYKLVFKYDPPIDHMNNPAMFCLCHEKHVYILNDNLESLAQKTSSSSSPGSEE